MSSVPRPQLTREGRLAGDPSIHFVRILNEYGRMYDFDTSAIESTLLSGGTVRWEACGCGHGRGVVTSQLFISADRMIQLFTGPDSRLDYMGPWVQ